MTLQFVSLRPKAAELQNNSALLAAPACVRIAHTAKIAIYAPPALQFRADFINIFTGATQGGPGDRLFGSKDFGSSTHTAATERVVQFALRLTF